MLFELRHRSGRFIRISGVLIALGTSMLSGRVPNAILRAQNPEISALGKPNCFAPGDSTIARQSLRGTLRFVGSDTGASIPHPRPAEAALSPLAAAQSYLSECGSLFGVNQPGTDLQAISNRLVEAGRSVVRFRQTHRGVPVIAGELIVHVDGGRNIRAVAGRTLPGIDLDPTPAITPQQAAQSAIDVVAKTYGVSPVTLGVSTPELWIYSPTLLGPGSGPSSVVWRMDVSPQTLGPIRELVLIDAKRGSVPLHFNQVDTLQNRNTYTAGNSTTLPGTIVCAESNPTCTGGDSHAIGAHLGAGDTYNFYSTTHARDGIDNAGMPIVSTVHFGMGYANAFWSGSQMVYGDEYGFPLADDVVAHELTHGVTQYTSNLFYYYQSGAINESLSDVWGELVDQTNGRGTDTPGVKWLLGEDVTGAGGGAIRSMVNPPTFNDPDKMTSSLYYLNDGDNGGVHINSGINNKAVFLMVDGGSFNGQTVVGLGITKVAKIYYEVQTNFLTSGSDYADLFDALYQGCTNLIGTSGINAGDCQQVRNATLAVEMNLQPEPNFNTDAAICPAGQVTTNIFFDDLESGPAKWATNNSSRWGVASIYAHSGGYGLWGDDFMSTSGASDSNVSMVNSVLVPSNAFLHFAHAYGFEGPDYDGGVVEYSINGGSTWSDAGSLFEANGYDGAINTGFSNPLAGRQAFIDDSHGYISSRLNLSSLAGRNIRFRWRMALDEIVYDEGWFLDDVRIYTCGTPPPAAATLVSPSGSMSGTTPTFTWNAVSNASSYYVWINDGSAAPRFTQWFTAAEAGCAGGTGTCAISTGLSLANGPGRWFVKTSNAGGDGPWSTAMDFMIGALDAPTLISPPPISTNNPTYTWDSVPGATFYYLWINDSSAAPKFTGWFDASDAGCASGTGTCSVTPGTFSVMVQGGGGHEHGTTAGLARGARRLTSS